MVKTDQDPTTPVLAASVRCLFACLVTFPFAYAAEDNDPIVSPGRHRAALVIVVLGLATWCVTYLTRGGRRFFSGDLTGTWLAPLKRGGGFRRPGTLPLLLLVTLAVNTGVVALKVWHAGDAGDVGSLAVGLALGVALSDLFWCRRFAGRPRRVRYAAVGLAYLGVAAVVVTVLHPLAEKRAVDHRQCLRSQTRMVCLARG